MPCVVSCGIWPGVSALMAAEAVSKLGGKGACDKLEFSFFTAGTGGAGPTIVSATFLLLATEVSCYINGELVEREPWTDRQVRDFGVGEHECFLLDNPDVPTTVEALGIRECSSRFGTAPSFWNTLFGAMKALPTSLLADKQKMQSLAVFSMPIIRTVDALVGGTNAMRVDAFAADGRQVTLRCVHPDLEDCVGQATAAFALECLSDAGTIARRRVVPGRAATEARRNIMDAAREKTLLWKYDVSSYADRCHLLCCSAVNVRPAARAGRYADISVATTACRLPKWTRPARAHPVSLLPPNGPRGFVSDALANRQQLSTDAFTAGMRGNAITTQCVQHDGNLRPAFGCGVDVVE